VVDERVVLLVTVALLTVYTVGIGGATAAAIGVRDSWRRRPRTPVSLDPRAGEVMLAAPVLPCAARALRVAGWTAFPAALVLGIFANTTYPWLVPLTVLLMVGLNAFYFTAMQGLGEPLTLTVDGFQVGDRPARRVRWVHVTDLMGAHIGAFKGIKMSEAGEWQDPKTVPNVIYYRLNRALVRPRKSVWQRLGGLNYYDGMVRNAFGVTTEQLLQAMRSCQRQALELEAPPLRRPRPGEAPGVRSREP
jgi:hypothetical protein